MYHIFYIANVDNIITMLSVLGLHYSVAVAKGYIVTRVQTD